MGCSGSSSAVAPSTSSHAGDHVSRELSKASIASGASVMSDSQHQHAHERLRKLRELDETTKIPFILVELRGIGNKDGYIEICGKDEYGVYAALDNFLSSSWRCSKLDAGDLDESTPVPFSDALYRWTGYEAQGDTGTSNMGLATMRLVDFMTNKLCWTLGVINGGNVGARGEIREQQVIFKAPHPLNMVAPHVMIELRSAGFIEVCGGVSDESKDILDKIESYLTSELAATPVRGHERFCDRYYKCASGVFKEQGLCGDNNLGLLTAKVCDAMVKFPGWSLATINGGNYGEDGTHREQQMVFRWDNHPLADQPHLLVELRDAGYIEVNGQNVGDIYDKLQHYLQKTWGCEYSQAPSKAKDRLCDCKFRWKPRDMMVASAEITAFFHHQGWQMQVCSQGTVKVIGMEDSREQQILFRPGSSGLGFVEPHLFVELYMGEGSKDLYSRNDVTQVLGNQHIRMCPVGNCGGAVQDLHEFVVEYLGGSPGQDRYNLDVFLSRGPTDNNLGCWTMRLCDFMVDRLGWSFVVCNVCNMGECGQHREQQLVFRYDGERRQIPVNKEDNVPLMSRQQFAGLQLPSYWKIPEILNFEAPRAITACDSAEIQALQEIVDHTFKRVLTRDRVYEYQTRSNEEMPYRLEVIHAFRSENASLYNGFAKRRRAYKGGDVFRPKTREAGAMLNDRLGEGEGLLFHGTNPSSAMGILKTGFALRNAGKSTGTMFGNGIYLAESSSKSDEYACDDSGGTFPQLNALLVCRSFIGKPHIVQDPGDHVTEAKTRGCDCVVGDREAKVGTYREFVFFEENQVLPEYTIIYRRQYDRAKVPEKMRQTTTGTTGKNWQVKMEKGWLNIPPTTNQEILSMQASGKSEFELKVGNFNYAFNLVALTQTNSKTGTVRNLRPPMVKQPILSRSSTMSTTCSSPSGRLSKSSSFAGDMAPVFLPAARTPPSSP